MRAPCRDAWRQCELLAATRGANAIAATVVAAAAQRGDQVFTKDDRDLEALAAQVDVVRA